MNCECGANQKVDRIGAARREQGDAKKNLPPLTPLD